MNEIERISQARQTLAQATTVEEVKDVRDKAEAVRLYVKQAGLGLQAQNECAEIKIRAERKGGELLREMEFSKGAATPSHDERALPKLSDMGMNYTQSSRWQLEASIPDDTFEEYIADVIAKPDELTTAGVLRLANKLQPKPETPPLPEGKYRVILADPPWQYSNAGLGGAAEKHYSTLSLEARIWDTLILCSPFQVYFAPEKAGGGFEIRLHNAPRSNVSNVWILLIVLHRARARIRL